VEPEAPAKSPEDGKEPQVRVVDRRWWARGDVETAGETAARKPTVVEDLERRLAETTAQLQSVLTDHRRALEEFEQVKTRIRRDISREVERGRRAVLAELLEVGDNLDRAVTAAEGSAATDAPTTTSGTGATAAIDQLARGVVLVRDQFRAKLEAFGVKRLEAIGLPFDATRHEAVSVAPVDDPARDGTVIAVAKEGYAIGAELLRPASVVVGRYEAQREVPPQGA
jgi:molecular chaperone GrpE